MAYTLLNEVKIIHIWITSKVTDNQYGRLSYTTAGLLVRRHTLFHALFRGKPLI